jgi:glycosyltransferase involved in cell wall biosynthesis
MANRAFVVSELYYPEETSTGYLLTRIAEGIAHDVPVVAICSQPTYSARGIRAPARERRHDVDIERCAGTTFDKNSLVGRALNAVTISLSLWWRVLRRVRRGDVVIVVTNPPFLPFGVLLACRLRGARCALLVHDVYPEVLVAAGLSRGSSVIARIAHVATKWLYRHSDRVIVLGRDMEALAKRKLDGDTSKIVVIPNWADADEIVPTPKATNALLGELGLAERFVVQYAGNMGRTHGLETLFAAAQRVHEDVRWLFIGSGAKKGWLEKSIGREGLESITVLGNRPREEQRVFLTACDVAVISFVPGMAGVSVPSRMYNIMAAGKPIIAVADEESELAHVVSEERIGWVVRPGDVDGLVALLDRIAGQPALVHEYGARARAVASTKYARPMVIDRYLRLVRELLAA